jgi:hypothetical protein
MSRVTHPFGSCSSERSVLWLELFSSSSPSSGSPLAATLAAGAPNGDAGGLQRGHMRSTPRRLYLLLRRRGRALLLQLLAPTFLLPDGATMAVSRSEGATTMAPRSGGTTTTVPRSGSTATAALRFGGTTSMTSQKSARDIGSSEARTPKWRTPSFPRRE